MLKINLLGGFRLTSDDAPVPAFNTPRLQELLAYLVLHRESPQSRQHLAFLLWPDSAEAQARTNLRNLIHLLRHSLPCAEDFVQIDAAALHWRPNSTFQLDVADFEQACKARDFDRAVNLYPGELLPDCYDDWIISERERLQQMLINALGQVVDQREKHRDFLGAIGAAQQLLRCDPLREETYRELMHLNALNGDRAAALHTYHACCTILRHELNVDPSPMTRELYERLSCGGPSQMITPLAPTLPFVGRAGEWSSLLAAWRTASDGGPQMILITGEAGIGKTRLAEELISWANRQGIPTALAHCYASEGALAYTPVIAWLRVRPLPRLEPVWLTEVARLLPELMTCYPSLAPPSALTEAWQRQRLHEALARALFNSRRTDGIATPLVLVIEDLQWCDQDTLEWLHYLLRFDLQARLLVVGTLRTEEMQTGPALSSLLAALRCRSQLSEVALGPLDRTETDLLVVHLAGSELAPQFAEWLYHETEGNPLFIVETVRAVLSEKHSSAPLAFSSAWHAMPSQVRAVIDARLAQLSTQARQLMEVAAIIGRAFTFDLLKQASGEDEAALASELDELWRRCIVREQSAAAYDFTHDKLRQAACANLSAVRSRLLHRRVAEAMEIVYAHDLDGVCGQVAAHYEQAGMLDRASEYYQRAAQTARRVYANEDAITLFRHALGLLKEIPPDHITCERAIKVYEELGDVCDLAGRYEEARNAYQEALVWVPLGERVWQAQLWRKIGSTSAQPADEQFRSFDKAEQLLGHEPVEQGTSWWQEWLEINLARLSVHYLEGNVHEMAVLIDALRPIVQRRSTRTQQSAFYSKLTQINMRRDRFVITDETLAYAQARLQAGREAADPVAIIEFTFGLGFVYLWRGDLDQAEENLQAALKLADQSGPAQVRVQCLTYLTVIHRKRGQVEMARHLASRSLADAQETNQQVYTAMAKANLAWIAWRGGDMAGARLLGQTALELFEQWTQWYGHTIYPFQWAALWPLIAIALAGREISRAIDHARALLAPSQQRLPDDLTVLLEKTLQAWEQNQPEAAQDYLHQSVELAQFMGYL